MVFNFYGANKTIKEIIKDVSFANDGSLRRAEMVRLAKSYGFLVQTKEPADIHNIMESLDRGVPVIVDYIEPEHNEGHYAVITGYDDEHFVLNDPWHGEGFKFNRKDFLSRWRSGFESPLPWLMVVSAEKTPNSL